MEKLINIIDDGTEYKNKDFIFKIIDYINNNQEDFINYYSINAFKVGLFSNKYIVRANIKSDNPILASLLDVFFAIKVKENDSCFIQISENEGIELAKLSEFLESKNFEKVLLKKLLEE